MLYQAELRSLPKLGKTTGILLESKYVFRGDHWVFSGRFDPKTYFCGQKAKATAASTQTKETM